MPLFGYFQLIMNQLDFRKNMGLKKSWLLFPENQIMIALYMTYTWSIINICSFHKLGGATSNHKNQHSPMHQLDVLSMGWAPFSHPASIIQLSWFLTLKFVLWGHFFLNFDLHITFPPSYSTNLAILLILLPY